MQTAMTPLAAEDEERARIAFARRRARGWLAWRLRYLLSRRFRWEEERAGWVAAIERRLEAGGDVGPAWAETVARRIAGRRWLPVAGFAEARRFFERAVDHAGERRRARAGEV